MSVLVITAEAYQTWRGEVTEGCVEGVEENAALQTKLRELDELFVRTEQPLPLEKRDVATQLCTVSGVSLTSQILRRFRAERAAKQFARDLGRLAALSAELCKDIGILLDLAVVGTVASTPPAEEPASAEEQAESLLSVLAPSALEAVCATSKAFRRWRETTATARKREEGSITTAVDNRSGPASSTQPSATDAQAFLQERLVQRFHLATQFLRERQEQLERNAEAHGGGFAFLCQRCRQDGRQRFLYDPEQRQLSKTARWRSRKEAEQQM